MCVHRDQQPWRDVEWSTNLTKKEIDQKQNFKWDKLQKAVQQHIKSLNWGYKADLLKMKVKYFNSYASFVD